jgi:hypothetical protein
MGHKTALINAFHQPKRTPEKSTKNFSKMVFVWIGTRLENTPARRKAALNMLHWNSMTVCTGERTNSPNKCLPAAQKTSENRHKNFSKMVFFRIGTRLENTPARRAALIWCARTKVVRLGLDWPGTWRDSATQGRLSTI